MTSLFLSLFLSLVAIQGYHTSSGRRSSLPDMGNALASSASPWLNSVQPGDLEQRKKSVPAGQMEGIWRSGAFPSAWKSCSLSLGGFPTSYWSFRTQSKVTSSGKASPRKAERAGYPCPGKLAVLLLYQPQGCDWDLGFSFCHPGSFLRGEEAGNIR